MRTTDSLYENKFEVQVVQQASEGHYRTSKPSKNLGASCNKLKLLTILAFVIYLDLFIHGIQALEKL